MTSRPPCACQLQVGCLLVAQATAVEAMVAMKAEEMTVVEEVAVAETVVRALVVGFRAAAESLRTLEDVAAGSAAGRRLLRRMAVALPPAAEIVQSRCRGATQQAESLEQGAAGVVDSTTSLLDCKATGGAASAKPPAWLACWERARLPRSSSWWVSSRCARSRAQQPWPLHLTVLALCPFQLIGAPRQRVG